MKITLNGETLETECVSLEDLLESLKFEESSFATAVNEEFVPASARASYELQQGDRIDLLVPMSGG